MEKIFQSRKLWGALLGSLSILIVVILDKPTASSAITALGVLWGTAIGGQAGADFISSRVNAKKLLNTKQDGN